MPGFFVSNIDTKISLKDMERLYNTGDASEKAMVLIVLAETKLYLEVR